MNCETASQINAAATDAQVPGPGRNLPIPKKVPVRVAQSGARVSVGSGKVSVFILIARKICLIHLIGNVVPRRRNHVLIAGPLAQIDHPATLAAKREVSAIANHRLFADGALDLNLWFARHSLILDRIRSPHLQHWLRIELPQADQP